MVRDAVEGLHRAFGLQPNLRMLEAVPTPDYHLAPVLGRSTQKLDDPLPDQDAAAHLQPAEGALQPADHAMPIAPL